MSRSLLLKRHFLDNSDLENNNHFLDEYKHHHDRSQDVYEATNNYHHHLPIIKETILDISAAKFYPDALDSSIPLDLSVKSNVAPITPPASPSPQRPPPMIAITARKSKSVEDVLQSPHHHKAFVKRTSSAKATSTSKKQKATRKLNFDEDKSSPVSGTIIRDRSEITTTESGGLMVEKGDIDPAYNVVEVTEEAKAELAKIQNKIGDYICRLCNEIYKDAFTLAQHRCSCIVHVEYKCPECEKAFNCPANLASHRRWHKPKICNNNTAATTATAIAAAVADNGCNPMNLQIKKSNSFPGAGSSRNYSLSGKESSSSSSLEQFKREYYEPDEKEENDLLQISCPVCQKLFRKQITLRRHLATHRVPEMVQGIHPSFNFHHIAAN